MNRAVVPPLRVFLTQQSGSERLTEQSPLLPGASKASLPLIEVSSARTFQTFLGFGGAFTEAAALTWQALEVATRSELLRDYFDPEHGHGYSLCRVPMGSCDFAMGNYAHVETPGDSDLASFSIDRDKQALIPFIRAAQRVARAPLRLLASPWSPPAWMKSNGDMNRGGSLLPEYRLAWARCFVRFIHAYADEGIPIWAVTVQNEPEASQRWDSCCYSAVQERDFVRDYLGPELHAAGLGEVRIVIWDHNRDRMLDRANVVYSDPSAADYVWGTGFHWYGGDHFDQVQQVHDAWPDKHLLFTEGCQEGGPHDGSWDLGERYAHSIINDLNRWTEGWIDWNLLLDETGGPNHVGNFCSAPILTDPSGALRHQSSYYYIGHFARFIRRGARRVYCSIEHESLEATAFINPDETLALVVLNRTEVTQRCLLRIDHADTTAVLPPRSITTYVGQSMSAVRGNARASGAWDDGPR